MLSATAVVCLSTLDWQFSWHPNHEIAYRFAAAGNRVLYVESTGLRRVRPADWRRALARLRTAAGRGPSLQKTHPNLSVYAPIVLPFPHAAWAVALNNRIVLRAIHRWRMAGAERRLIVWAYLASPLTLAVIDRLKPDAVVFHYMGDAKAGRPLPQVARAEADLLARSDLILANSVMLLDEARRFSANAHLFRAGVDVDAFLASGADAPRPSELVGRCGPIAGYVGSMHEWLDLDLLAGTARRLPGWHFLLIGPAVRGVGPLLNLPNVRWLGPRPHSDLPRYIAHFDVCLIPYVIDAYTESSYPGKLNEYLSLGKPVVTTALPEIAAFNAEFGDVAYLVSSPAEFAETIVRARVEDSEALRRRRVAAARANSWESLLERASMLIEETYAAATNRAADANS